MGIRIRLVAALALVALVPPALLVLRAGPMLRDLEREAVEGRIERVEGAAWRLLAERRGGLERDAAAWIDALVGGDRFGSTLVGARDGRRLRDAAEEAMRLASVHRLERAAVIRVTALVPAEGLFLAGDGASVDDAIGLSRRGPEPWRWSDDDRLVCRVAILWPGDDLPGLVFVAERSLSLGDFEEGLARESATEVEVLPWRPGRPPAEGEGPEALLASPDGVQLAVARLAASPAEGRARLLRFFLETAAVGTGAALLLAVALGASLARPVRGLARAVERITASDDAPPAPMPSAPGELGTLSHTLDRTFLRLREERRERAEAERLAGWREVARRVAHEVKNPLTPIRLAVGNLRRSAASNPAALATSVEEEGAAIEQEVMRLERLVRSFSEFARLPSPTLAPVSLRELLTRAIALQDNSEGIAISLHADPELPETISLDADLVSTAVSNLLLNAKNALAERGGKIGVSAAPSAAPDDPLRPGIAVVVHDDGPGLPEELISRIFEPYVTGREGAGTGLGLAIVRRVVLDHGGRIDVRNEGGARFEIWLPAR